MQRSKLRKIARLNGKIPNKAVARRIYPYLNDYERKHNSDGTKRLNELPKV